MRKLQRFMTPERLAQVYANQYQHTYWPSHKDRVQVTVEIAQRLIDAEGIKTIADFSAGDRAIVSGLKRYEEAHLSDITDDGVDILDRLRHCECTYDLFICTETIEHVEQPWALLEEIAVRTRWLLLSTPLDEDPNENNWEHYWSFEAADIDDLLVQSGFPHGVLTTYRPDTGPYTYQIWIARSEKVA